MDRKDDMAGAAGKTPASPRLTEQAKAAEAARRQREAKALRANLARRKQAARENAATPPPNGASR